MLFGRTPCEFVPRAPAHCADVNFFFAVCKNSSYHAPTVQEPDRKMCSVSCWAPLNFRLLFLNSHSEAHPYVQRCWDTWGKVDSFLLGIRSRNGWRPHSSCTFTGSHRLRKGDQCPKLTLSDWSHSNSAGPPNGPHNVIHPSRTQSPGNTLIDSSRRHSGPSAQADLSITEIWIW